MTTVRYDAASDSYFSFDTSPDDEPHVINLRWNQHPGAPNVWWTRSPYLAAPLWPRVAPDDAETRTKLGWFAWNYWTSFAEAPLQGTGFDAVRIPAGEEPYPFQVAGIQRGLLRSRMLIADEPGLGKSAQSLVVANMLRPKRIVIGCPTVLMDNWGAECAKWLVDPQPIAILNSSRKAIPDTGVSIVPYSRGHVFHEKILAGPPVDCLILDEVHYLKAITAKRTVPWLGQNGIAVHAKQVTALSGTPIPNNPLEIYPLLRILSPETIGALSFEKFKATYCSTFKGMAKVPGRNGDAMVAFEKNEGKHEHALNAELRASGVMVRRLKDDVLKQLPPKHVYLVHLTPNAAIEELVREESDIYRMLQQRILPAKELLAIQGHLMAVRARLGALKAPKIAEFLKSIFESGETHVVLFMLHLEAIEIVRKAFEAARVNVRILTGAQSPRARNDHVKAFQKSNDLELVIGQVTAAGVGLTMTRARYCVLGEISWTPSANDQAIDRVHRLTQTRQVEAPIITFPHAVEEHVIRTNARKAVSIHTALDINLQEMINLIP